jgi:hypothetical protein
MTKEVGLKSNLCYDRSSVGQSVLVSSTHLGPNTSILLLSHCCGFVVGRPLARRDGSVVYNCCWSSPAQSFPSLSPAELMTIFYCPIFGTPPTWRVSWLYPQALRSLFIASYESQGYDGRIRTRLHAGQVGTRNNVTYLYPPDARFEFWSRQRLT